MPEPAQNYELSNCRPCRNIDISGDGLQFLCISLWFQERVGQKLGRGHKLNDNFMPGGASHSIHKKCAPCAHWFMYFVFRFTRFEKINKIDYLGVQYSTFLMCFTRFERVPGNKIDCLEVTKCPHSPFLLCFTRFERMLGDTIESLRVPPLTVSAVCMLWEDTR